jgi:hypothetical protein
MESRLKLATESELLALATKNYLKSAEQPCSIEEHLQTEDAIQECLRRGRISLVLKGINSLVFKSPPFDLSLIVDLNLSNNSIRSLEGIEQFNNLRSLSLCANKIEHWEELLRVKGKRRLNWLKVEGNPLEFHPNYKFELCQAFPRLSILNNNHITEELRCHFSDTYRTLAHRIVPFVIFLNDFETHLSNFLKYTNISKSIAHEQPKAGSFYSQFQAFTSEANALHLSEGIESKLRHFFNVSKILRTSKKNTFAAQTDDAEEEVITSTTSQLTLAIMKGASDFKNFFFTSEELNSTYTKLFRTILKKYNDRKDASLIDYLKSQVLANEKGDGDMPVSQPAYDMSIFCESRKYAMECLLIEFYNLYPNKSSIASSIKFQVVNNKRFYFMENWVRDAQSKANAFENRVGLIDRGQNVGSLPVDCLKENLALKTDFYFNDFFESQVLIDFPLFPLNTRYCLTLFEIVLERIDNVLNLANESRRVFEQRLREAKPNRKPVQNNAHTIKENNRGVAQKSLGVLETQGVKVAKPVTVNNQIGKNAKNRTLSPLKGLEKLAALFNKKQQSLLQNSVKFLLDQIILRNKQLKAKSLVQGLITLHNCIGSNQAKTAKKALSKIKHYAYDQIRRHLRLAVIFKVLRGRVQASKRASSIPPIILRKYFTVLRTNSSSKRQAVMTIVDYLSKKYQRLGNYYLTKLQLFSQMKKRTAGNAESSKRRLPDFPLSFDIEVKEREYSGFDFKRVAMNSRKCDACDQFGFIY